MIKLLAVDSNSILNRAFYGVRPLTNKEGIYTNGIYGFFQIVLKLIADLQPDHTVFTFDLKAPTFRHKMYDGYKAQRKGMPQELAMQLPLLKELIIALGYPIVELEGFEADDLLGTISRQAAENGDECIIATGDRDSFQLIESQVTVLLAASKAGRAEYTPYTPETIREKYGLEPKQLIDVKALMGDSSDNIPGVPGVGEKTALALIQQFGSLEGVYNHLEAPEIKAGVRAKLQAGREMAELSRKLAEIDRCAPVPYAPNGYRRNAVDEAAAYRLLTRLEIFSLIERLGLTPGEALPPQEDAPKPAAYAFALLDRQQAGNLAAGEGPLYLLYQPSLNLLGALEQDVLYAGECSPEITERLFPCSRPKYTHDCKLLYRKGLDENAPFEQAAFDTALAAYLLSPNSTDYSLTRLAEEYSVSRPAPEKAEEIPENWRDFCGNVAVLPQLCAILEQKIEENEQKKLLEEIELPLSEVLASMEQLGFELDADGLTRFGQQLDIDLDRLQRQIYEYAGYEFNINSPKQLGEVLFIKLGLPAKKKTKSGYSTNAEVLEGLRGYHPIIGEILEYRKVAKLKSTYVEGLLKEVREDGRIRSSFNQTETRTGRISSAEPNLQNIPVRTELGSNLRRFFRAREGCMLVDADYSQIELRVLASISGDQNMIDAFLSGEDIHTNTASQVFDIPPLFVTPLMRSRAKAVNFGIVYGIGAFSLSQDIGVSIAEADQYIKNYLKTFAGVKKYMDETKRLAAEQGYVTTLFHRRRYLPELAASNKVTRAFGERVAMNTPIQGTAADIIKIAMIRVYRRLKEQGLQAKLILQVHDELIVETPEEEIEQVKVLLKEEMEQAAAMAVPLTADVNVGKTWYESK